MPPPHPVPLPRDTGRNRHFRRGEQRACARRPALPEVGTGAAPPPNCRKRRVASVGAGRRRAAVSWVLRPQGSTATPTSPGPSLFPGGSRLARQAPPRPRPGPALPAALCGRRGRCSGRAGGRASGRSAGAERSGRAECEVGEPLCTVASSLAPARGGRAATPHGRSAAPRRAPCGRGSGLSPSRARPCALLVPSSAPAGP